MNNEKSTGRCVNWNGPCQQSVLWKGLLISSPWPRFFYFFFFFFSSSSTSSSSVIKMLLSRFILFRQCLFLRWSPFCAIFTVNFHSNSQHYIQQDVSNKQNMLWLLHQLWSRLYPFLCSVITCFEYMCSQTSIARSYQTPCSYVKPSLLYTSGDVLSHS